MSLDLDLVLKDPEQAIPATKVELSVTCRKLRDMDVLSKSDPMCVLFIKTLGSEEYKEVGRTEVIDNNLNPNFVRKFLVDYFFEEVQHLKFEVYDVDSKNEDLKKHDFIGRITCTMGEIMATGGGVITRELKGKVKKCGTITVRGEELSSCRDLIYMTFRGEQLDKKDTFGKSDPFLVICRKNADEGFTVCHKTEVIKKTLEPKWKEFKIHSRALCNGDYDRPIKFECYDWNRDGGHELIGVFETTSRELSRGPSNSNRYQLIHPKLKEKKKNYKHSGMIILENYKVEKVHSFLAYIRDGTQMNFTVAVDFTASNGDPRHPTSLHYINPNQPNHYIRALRAVGEVIEDYDSDKLYPAFGFGARVPPDMKVSHEFHMNGKPDASCEGLKGVIEAYQNSLKSVQLYGPTNFAPIITRVAREAAAKRDGTEYFILLIITDGEITDMQNTKQAIVKAAKLPMSIIIVGVGNENFTAMEELDGDEVRLSFQGEEAERDIVQFVPFREFENNSNIIISQAQLAKEVLSEIPDQFLSYMRKNGINPKPKRGSVTSMASRESAISSTPPKR
ncbi:Copine-8 [Holothuria leucospilota]|uniref:Copine-8 n=1 Tax=Holothuria leucospilota TaxID=206669 RepID=A0A9Q1HAE0_HOLLE|nr:Copine-8 [Holothuria leucospilota]